MKSNNNDYIKNMLLKIKKIQHDMNDLIDYYEENYITNKNLYGTPFFRDIRETNHCIKKWVDDFQNKYSKIEHQYKINKMDILETGGYIYTYIGKLEDNFWFSHCDDEIYIYDEEPFVNDCDVIDDYTWHTQHLVDTLNPNNKNKYFYEQMDKYIDNIVTDEDFKIYFHNHFNELFKEIESNNYEI